jgi:4-amino-4-deoxy-L-arabinose transferase-like glycosyltransferase
MACLDVADLGGAGVESPQKGARGAVVGDAWRLAVIVTIAAALTRLVVAAFTPLFPDETYYWEFSRRLAGGYFDHPPVIAWLVRFGTLLFGDTSLGVRFGAVIAGAVAALFTAAAARRLRGPRGALIAAVVFALMPLSTGLTLATPDAPLLCFVAATLYALLRALEHEPRSRESLRWWCAAGVALGFAVASKYTAALVGLALFLGMLAIPQLRARLRAPGPYLGTGIALLVFSPVIAWNATHDWASFAFQLKHGLAPVGGSALKRELELLGGQAALVSPVLFVLLFVASFRALGGGSRTASAQHPAAIARRLLSVVALLVFAFFIYSATKRRVEANWPALAYIAAIIVFATHAGTGRWGRWSRIAVTIAGFITGATFLNTITPILPVPARADPVARSAGWDEFAHAVQLELERRAESGRGIWVGTDRYQEASQLAFHLVGRPTTFAMNLTTRPNSYDYWPGFPQLARQGDALVLVLDQVGESQPVHPTVSLLRDHFTQVRRGDAFTVSRRGEPLRHVQIWILDGWRGTWPRAVVGSGS